MKVTRTGRSLELRGLPAEVEGIKTPKKLGPLVISVMYEGDGNANKAIILDNHVIPIIVRALECDGRWLPYVRSLCRVDNEGNVTRNDFHGEEL